MKTHDDDEFIEPMRKTEIAGQKAKGKPMRHGLHYFGIFTQISLLIFVSLLAGLPTPAMATKLESWGGRGGNTFEALCANGSYLVGLAGRTGAWIDQIAPICSPWLPIQHVFGVPSIETPLGTSTGGNANDKRCPAGFAVNNWTVNILRSGNFIEYLEFNCAKVEPPAATQKLQFGSEPGERGFLSGGAFRAVGDQDCPAGELAVGFHGRAGRFLDAVGLICGPGPKQLGTSSPSKAGSTPSALPTAPTINLPKGFIVKGKGIFKITPSRYLTGIEAQVELKWLNPPARVKSLFQYEAPMSLIAGPNGIDAPDLYLEPGKWELRVRILKPKAGEWSEVRRFQYYLKNPVATTKPKASPPRTGPNPCNAGFVQRLANATDHVCVTLESHQRVLQENATAASRRNPQGPYGPNTCLTGFVWREAFAGDLVCVTPAIRQLVREENALNASRTPEIPGTTLIRPRGVEEKEPEPPAVDTEKKP